uniref:Gypsy retrotransposon integrase-like protein 1 n=1 Tax=Crocodylus porosus TaxID=8502 RepID=A0A7M4F2V9_CROPO
VSGQESYQGVLEGLAQLRQPVSPTTERAQGPRVELRWGLLYRIKPGPQTGEEIEQLLIPRAYRAPLLWLAHGNPMGGHLGKSKTEARLTRWCFWPHLYEDVENFCKACQNCQKVSPHNPIYHHPLLLAKLTFSPRKTMYPSKNKVDKSHRKFEEFAVNSRALK